MGNSSRPGTVVVREIDHDPFAVGDGRYFVRELVWNGISGRSYDLVNCDSDDVLTDESFDTYPTDAQIAAVLDDHGVDAELETCTMCGNEVLLATAHRWRNGWVGENCCWDERLRMTA